MMVRPRPQAQAACSGHGLGEKGSAANSLCDLHRSCTALGLSFPTVPLVGRWVLESLGLPERDSFTANLPLHFPSL